MDENEEIVTTIYDNVSRQYSWKSKVCDQYGHMFNSFMCMFGTWRCDISATDCPLYVFIQGHVHRGVQLSLQRVLEAKLELRTENFILMYLRNPALQQPDLVRIYFHNLTAQS